MYCRCIMRYLQIMDVNGAYKATQINKTRLQHSTNQNMLGPQSPLALEFHGFFLRAGLVRDSSNACFSDSPTANHHGFSWFFTITPGANIEERSSVLFNGEKKTTSRAVDRASELLRQNLWSQPWQILLN